MTDDIVMNMEELALEPKEVAVEATSKRKNEGDEEEPLPKTVRTSDEPGASTSRQVVIPKASRHEVPEESTSSGNNITDFEEYEKELMQMTLTNIELFNKTSCKACKHSLCCETNNKNKFKIILNKVVVGEGYGRNINDARKQAVTRAWNTLKNVAICVLVKEVWVPNNDTRIGIEDLPFARPEQRFGVPVDRAIANRLMKKVGKEGRKPTSAFNPNASLKPIQPVLKMITRAGLDPMDESLEELLNAAALVMLRFKDESAMDVDLVFSTEFSNEERTSLHFCALRCGLVSRSYGFKTKRFLVVRKTLNPFYLVESTIAEGGNSERFQVFIPVGVAPIQLPHVSRV